MLCYVYNIVILTIFKLNAFLIASSVFKEKFLNNLFLLCLNDLINNRRETILQSLQEADNKFREAEENLRFASENLNSAKLKAQQIRTQGNVLAQKTYESVLETIENDIKRLEAVSLSTIRFEEDKSMNEVV